MGYFKSQAKRAAREMLPHRVLWRMFGPGTAFPTRKHLKRKYLTERTVATGSRQDYERMLAAAARPAKKNAAKTAAKKPAGKGCGDVYAAARAIPARNQAAAKKSAATPKGGKRTTSGRVQIPKQNPDGRFDGSVSFPSFGPREQALYERAQSGWLDPAQRVRRPRGLR